MKNDENPSLSVCTRGLRKDYDDVVAVRNLNLEVPRGSIFGLIGPNGAGKTTLLKMIAALIPPTQGEVIVEGISAIHSPREVHAKIGFLPDVYGLYDTLTVEEYLEYFARAYFLPLSKIPSVISTILEQMKLCDKRKNRIEELSRGMRQRVGLARTLIHDPDLLLLDEPASGLDPEARHDLQFLFRDLAKAGKTLIVSSHILTELESYCTHVAILHQGVLKASDTVENAAKLLGKVKTVKVKVLSREIEFLEILKKNSQVQKVHHSGGAFEFLFSGEDAELAELLKGLMMEGFSILSFAEEISTIQDVYLSLMEGKAT